MVYIEALLAGVPVLHSRGRGIDGSFGSAAIGYACDPVNQADIVRGIETLIADEAVLKASITRLAADGGLDRFKRAAIVADYHALLARITAAPAIAAGPSRKVARSG
jgi:hypothetical protein